MKRCGCGRRPATSRGLFHARSAAGTRAKLQVVIPLFKTGSEDSIRRARPTVNHDEVPAGRSAGLRCGWERSAMTNDLYGWGENAVGVQKLAEGRIILQQLLCIRCRRAYDRDLRPRMCGVVEFPHFEYIDRFPIDRQANPVGNTLLFVFHSNLRMLGCVSCDISILSTQVPSNIHPAASVELFVVLSCVSYSERLRRPWKGPACPPLSIGQSRHANVQVLNRGELASTPRLTQGVYKDDIGIK